MTEFTFSSLCHACNIMLNTPSFIKQTFTPSFQRGVQSLYSSQINCQADRDTNLRTKSRIHKNRRINRETNKNNVLLNIAITGESGSGKSSFVNAFRDVEDDSEDAAPTGVVETTLEVKEYPHPNYPNIIFSDLPGIGTTKFPAKKYLKRVGFKKFDFFIIISADRFRENDAKLAKEIKKMGKNFYFVRSKCLLLTPVLKRVKTFLIYFKKIDEIIKDQGVESPQVFLVSSHDIHLYDFPLLRETLERDLPEHKRDALLLSSPYIFPDIIEKKKKVFMRQIWGLTALSGVVAAVPVPGLSVGVDLALLVGAVTRYVTGFGLNVASLKRTASRTGIPYDELKAVLTSQLATDWKLILLLNCFISFKYFDRKK
uniref:Interferon-inducible GTPase 5-like n=1 Tax=Poecilia latipinna TaxID=48699 RepID=A0A3B3UJA6_9TELE